MAHNFGTRLPCPLKGLHCTHTHTHTSRHCVDVWMVPTIHPVYRISIMDTSCIRRGIVDMLHIQYQVVTIRLSASLQPCNRMAIRIFTDTSFNHQAASILNHIFSMHVYMQCPWKFQSTLFSLSIFPKIIITTPMTLD